MDVSHSLTKYPLAFTAVSIGNEPEIISVMLATYIKLPTHSSYVITFNETNATGFRDKSGFTKEIKVITYEDIDMESLKDVKHSTIVFDNLSNIELINIGKNHSLSAIEYLLENDNWVIILGNSMTSPREIKNLSDMFPKTHFWNDKFADVSNCINYVLNKSKMTDLQEIRYNVSENYYFKTLGLIPDKRAWQLQDYPNAKRFCNIVYPPSIQSMIETSSEGENLLLPKPNELVATFGMATILQNSPKFQQLFNKINFGRRLRHVIFTNFENYFGTGILEAIFNFIDIPVLRIDSEKSNDENLKIMEQFNKNKEIKILLISKAFPEIPKNVDVLHILDYNLPEAYSKIYQIYKYRNYTNSENMPPKLNVEMYCTSKKDGKSVDDITFDEFFPFILSQRDFWKFTKNSSLNLVVNSNNRIDAVV